MLLTCIALGMGRLTGFFEEPSLDLSLFSEQLLFNSNPRRHDERIDIANYACSYSSGPILCGRPCL